jgi:hypothetical protein
LSDSALCSLNFQLIIYSKIIMLLNITFSSMICY